MTLNASDIAWIKPWLIATKTTRPTTPLLQASQRKVRGYDKGMAGEESGSSQARRP
ncbi:MAG: hypothetical protein Q8R82_04745 [Hyphomonadaceae bacterium]|nr:hypothetical protein [Hyphomonadaceae bacterium]